MKRLFVSWELFFFKIKCLNFDSGFIVLELSLEVVVEGVENIGILELIEILSIEFGEVIGNVLIIFKDVKEVFL